MSVNQLAKYTAATSLLDAPALGAFVIDPSDENDLPSAVRAITINGGGTIAFLSWNDTPHSTGTLPSGTYVVCAKRVLATGTTASDMTGWI